MRRLASWKVKVLVLSVLVVGTAALGGMAALGQPMLPPGVHPEVTADPHNPLLVSSRNRLAICVDGVGSAAAAVPDARQRVQQALSEVMARNPTWTRLLPSAGTGALVIDTDCPGKPYLLQSGVVWEDGVPITGTGQVVQQPSPYMVHVYLLPPEELKRVIRGQHDVRTAAQELFCPGKGAPCMEVTTGVYPSAAEGGNQTLLRQWLGRGLGLESRTGLPANAPISDPQRR